VFYITQELNCSFIISIILRFEACKLFFSYCGSGVAGCENIAALEWLNVRILRLWSGWM